MLTLREKGRIVSAVAIATLVCALQAQTTWVWNQQCTSDEWAATCTRQDASCGGNNLRYFNNWGLSQCNSAPGLPQPGDIVIFPDGANALLSRSVNVRSITVDRNAIFRWQSGSITLLDNTNPGTMTNAGLLRLVTNTTRFLSGALVNTGTLLHEVGNIAFNGASLQNSGAAEIRDGSWYVNAGTNSLVNTGTLTKTTNGSVTINIPMQQQDATVEVQAGTLNLSGGGVHQDARWRVAGGATLVFTGTHALLTNDWGATLQGTIRLSSGTYTVSGVWRGQIEGAFVQQGGTVQASGATTFDLTGTGYQWESGTLDGGSAGITNAGLLRLVTNTTRRLSGVVVNTGTLLHEAGSVSFNGASLQNSGAAEIRDGSWYVNAGTNRFVNTGTLTKTTTSRFSISVNTTNGGLIDVRNGTLSVSNLAQTEGETRLHRGARLSVSNPLALQGGKLTGAGQLDGALNNTAGTIVPGIDDPDQPDLNPLGILTLNGNLTMGNDAVFEVELAGTDNSDSANPQYDQVLIAGTRTLQLNGVLRVKGRDGYTPAVGDTFDIIVRSSSSWNRTGQFRTVEVDIETLPCVRFEVRYLTDRVQLVVTQGVGSPDINRDGCVNDADLLAVLFAIGQTGDELPEDTNCDGSINDVDLRNVLLAFGSGC